jgi:PAS domain S-box-containing protein
VRFYLPFVFLFLLIQNPDSLADDDSDSISILLASVNKEEKLETLNSLAFKFRVKQPEKTVELANQALQLAHSLGNLKGERVALSNLGMGYRYQGDYNEALKYQQQALTVAQQLKNQKYVAAEYNRIGIIYKRLGLYSIALDYYKKALKVREELNDTIGIANLSNNIGNVYRRQGDLDMALEYYFNTLKIRKELNDKEGYSYILNNIGNIYSELELYEQALDYHNQSLLVKQELGNKYGVSSSYGNIGDIYLVMGKPEKALEYFLKVKEIAEEMNDNSNIATSLTDIGRANIALDDFNRAEENLSKALQIMEEIGNKTGIIRTCISFSNLYISLKKYREAIYYLEKAQGPAEDEKLLSFLSEIYHNYSDIYSKTGQPSKALDYFRKYSALRDSIINTDIGKKITELQVEQKTEKVEMENHLLSEQNKVQELSLQQKNLLIYSLGAITILILTLITLLFSRFRNKQKANKELEEKNKSITEKNIFLQVLMDTIPNPMFYTDTQGRLLGCNKAFRSFHHKTEDELKGMVVYDLYSKDVANICFKDDLLLRENKGMRHSELRIRLDDGKEHDLIFYKNTYLDSKNEFAGLLGIMLDITNRKRAEDNLKRSENELRELNATKDKFFSIIAHDLKNPFNVIMGFSDLLSTGYDHYSDDEKRKMIKNLHEASANTYKLLQNLLEWAKAQLGKITVKPEVFDLKNIADENVEVFSSVAKNKNINIESEIPDKTLVKADKNMINTVVRNLISNAIKFTPEGGKIEISARILNGHTEFCVADSGVGIKSENIGKLFSISEQFKSVGTNNETGSGLGLILCKEFVEKNNGTIWVESEYESGSTFRFILLTAPLPG